jgi:hypothetical protein
MTVAIAIPQRGSPKIETDLVGVASLAASATAIVGRTGFGVAAGFLRDAAVCCVTAGRDFMVEILLVT